MLLEWGELQASIDGSIIDENIDPTEALHGLDSHRLGTLGIAHVRHDPQRLAAGMLDCGDGLGTR